MGVLRQKIASILLLLEDWSEVYRKGLGVSRYALSWRVTGQATRAGDGSKGCAGAWEPACPGACLAAEQQSPFLPLPSTCPIKGCSRRWEVPVGTE